MKLTPTMVLILTLIGEGQGPYKGCVSRSEYGGRGGSVYAVFRRGLITRARDGRSVWALTEAGREALAQARAA